MYNPSSSLENSPFRPSRFSDPSLLEQRLAALKAECEEIFCQLSQADRAILEEYLTLLQDRLDWQIQNAYQSGIQVGQRRNSL